MLLRANTPQEKVLQYFWSKYQILLKKMIPNQLSLKLNISFKTFLRRNYNEHISKNFEANFSLWSSEYVFEIRFSMHTSFKATEAHLGWKDSYHILWCTYNSDTEKRWSGLPLCEVKSFIHLRNKHCTDLLWNYDSTSTKMM